MKKGLKGILLRYGIASLIGGLLAWMVIEIRGYSSAAPLSMRYMVLCDAFTVPGILLFLSGLLVFVANEGAFEGVSYVFSRAKQALVPFSKKKDITYGDYVEERRKKEKIKGYSFLILTGLAFLAVAVVFLVLFNRVS